jgi:hypothetical protein
MAKPVEYCLSCRGQGIVWTRLNDQSECVGYFVFLCKCQWGQAERRAYPRWNSAYAKVYTIDKKPGDPEPKPLGLPAPSGIIPYSPKTNLDAFNDQSDDLF